MIITAALDANVPSISDGGLGTQLHLPKYLEPCGLSNFFQDVEQMKVLKTGRSFSND